MNNLPVKKEAIPVNLPPSTNTSEQNASPIALEAPALNDQAHATATRQASNLNANSETIAQEIFAAICNNDPEQLNTCLENLGSTTQETIFSVPSQRFDDGKNLLMYAIASKNPEIVKLVLPLCQQLSKETLQALLLLQEDIHGENYLMMAIGSKNPEALRQILPLCQQLSKETLQALLLQQNQDENNCLMLAIESRNPEMLNLFLPLCQQLLQENFQDMFLQQDNYERNCLMMAIGSKNPEALRQILPLCQQLSKENLQALLLQEDISDYNCLMQAVSKNSEILKPIVDLYAQVPPQILEDAMRDLEEKEKELVQSIINQIRRKFTKSARNA